MTTNEPPDTKGFEQRCYRYFFNMPIFCRLKRRRWSKFSMFRKNGSEYKIANKASKQAETRHGILISVSQTICGKDQFLKKYTKQHGLIFS